MIKINLQNKTHCLKGKAEYFWFENQTIDLKKTLYHRFEIPLTPFNSGLEFEKQPVETKLIFEWINLKLNNPKELDGVYLNSVLFPETECSVYVGSAHNTCEIINLSLQKKEKDCFLIKGEVCVNFEKEGVALNELFTFDTEIECIN